MPFLSWTSERYISLRFRSRHQIWNKYSLRFHTGDIVAVRPEPAAFLAKSKTKQTSYNDLSAFLVLLLIPRDNKISNIIKTHISLL